MVWEELAAVGLYSCEKWHQGSSCHNERFVCELSVYWTFIRQFKTDHKFRKHDIYTKITQKVKVKEIENL